MFKAILHHSLVILLINIPFVVFGQSEIAQADSLYDSILEEVEANHKSKKYTDIIELIDKSLSSPCYKFLHCDKRAILHHKLGRAYYSLADYEQSMKLFSQQTIPLWESCNIPAKVKKADTYFAAAMAGQVLRDFASSIPYLNYALELYESVPDFSLSKLGHKYRGAGVLHARAKEFELAELFYLKSISYFKQSEADDIDIWIGILYNDLGLMSRQIGEFDKAINYYKKSYVMHESIEIHGLHNIATVYSEDLSDISSASYYSELEMKKAFKSENANLKVDALIMRGRIEFKKKNYNEALLMYKEATDLCDDLIKNNHNVRLLASIYENIAESELELGNYNKSINDIDQAIDLMVANYTVDASQGIKLNKSIVREIDELIAMIAFKANSEYNFNNSKNIKVNVDHSLGLYYIIDSLFQYSLESISLNQSQIDATGEILVHYEDAIIKNMEQFEKTSDIRYYNDAYYFSSRLKALNLSSSLRKYQKLNESDKVRSKEINSELASLLVEYYNGIGNTDSISVELIKKQREKHQFEQKIINEKTGLSSDSAQLTEYNLISNIQNKLHDDEILLEFFEGAKTLYTFKIEKSAVDYHDVDINSKNMNALDTFVKACQSPNFHSSADMHKMGGNLFSLLFGDLFESNSTNIEKLIIIPDGKIHSIPIEALIKNNNYLIQLFDIKYAYSHNLYFDSVDRKFGLRYVGFGPSYSDQLGKKIVLKRLAKLDGNLVDIPMAVEEVERSMNNFKDRKVFVNSDATKEQFINQASSADILHLSMHGLVDYETPGNSSLLFHDGVDDFALRASEIGQLDINPDLVILSSCQSASGAINRAEGVQGLSRAFILAGSSAVLSSLWNTSEYSSSVLLPNFLNSLKQSRIASTSLRDAKLSYLASARPSMKHPFYWANFILISGEESSPNSMLSPIIILMVGLSILLLLFFIFKRTK